MSVRHVKQRRQRPGAVGSVAIRRRVGRHGPTCLLLLLMLAGTGCRSGVRSLSAPKWPSFGGAKAKPIDAPALASVPTNDAPIKKPSASAVPYPTTSTPAGYVVNDPATASGGGAEGIQTAATDPAMVTYGVTPPLQAAPAIAPPAPPTAFAEATPPAAISPQVGPYATLPPPPAAAETPIAPGIPSAPVTSEPSAFAASPALAGPPGGGYPVTPPAQAAPAAYGAAPPSPTSFPATAGYEPSARVADARGFEPSAGVAGGAIPAPQAPAAESAPPLAPIVDPGSGVAARYASTGSRYGGVESSLPPAPTGPSAPAAFPAAPPPLPAAPPPPGPLPVSNPDGLTSPPVRRPDPVFRPGGTSSYRPAEQIFVDETPVAPAAVRTASYEVNEPAPPPPVGLQ